MKAAQTQVTAKRRAFPRHAPGTHAAALEALEAMRQNQGALESTQPQVGFAIATCTFYVCILDVGA